MRQKFWDNTPSIRVARINLWIFMLVVGILLTSASETTRLFMGLCMVVNAIYAFFTRTMVASIIVLILCGLLFIAQGYIT